MYKRSELMTQSRGYRNNNPLNIRYTTANKWRGLVGHDKEMFCKFCSLAYGYRAAFVLLLNYHVKYGASTLWDIISRFAPSEDGNNVVTYCQFLRDSMPYYFPENDYMSIEFLKSPNSADYFNTRLYELIFAMTEVENGLIVNEHWKQFLKVELKRGILLAQDYWDNVYYPVIGYKAN